MREQGFRISMSRMLFQRLYISCGDCADTVRPFLDCPLLRDLRPGTLCRGRFTITSCRTASPDELIHSRLRRACYAHRSQHKTSHPTEDATSRDQFQQRRDAQPQIGSETFSAESQTG